MKLSRVEIADNGHCGYDVKVDGVNFGNIATKAVVAIEPGSMPEVTLRLAGTTRFNGCAIVEYKNANLNAMAKVIQEEFMQKGEWYNALVASIQGYLRENGMVNVDELSKGLADRLIGD